MDLRQFKAAAMNEGGYYDNSRAAGEAWAKSWGLTWWRNVWAYKEYRHGGMVYRSGRVTLRHGGYQHTECEVNGEPVTLYRFKKALATA